MTEPLSNATYPSIALTTATPEDGGAAAVMKWLVNDYTYDTTTPSLRPHVVELTSMEDYWQRRADGYKIVVVHRGLHVPLDFVTDGEIVFDPGEEDDAWTQLYNLLRRWAR